MQILIVVHQSAPRWLLAGWLVVSAILGWLSADYGRHWDERKLQLSLRDAVMTGTVLPGWYNYPSAMFDVALATGIGYATVDAARDFAAGQDGFDGIRRELGRYFMSESFKLRLRSLFFLLGMLAALPVFLVARDLSGSEWTGLVAAMLLTSSWEYVYHARWIAPDALLAALVSWSAYCQSRVLESADKSQRPSWIVASAIVAGLCAGMKYPGSIVLVSMVLAIVLSRPDREGHGTTRRVGIALAIAALVFLLTTPGSVLEPGGFQRDVRYEMSHYAEGHGGWSVRPGADHGLRLAVYLGGVAASASWMLALAVSTSALIGVTYLARTSSRLLVWLLSVPLAYAIYMSSQSAMVVRNYLLLFPYLAILAAFGWHALRDASTPWIRRPVVAAAVLVIGFNVGSVAVASLRIHADSPEPLRPAVTERLARQPDQRFFLSTNLRTLLGDTASSLPNVVEDFRDADRVVFHTDEVMDRTLLRANWPGRYRVAWERFSEVNPDYYPAWGGHGRVLSVSTSEPELTALLDYLVGPWRGIRPR